MRGRAGVAEPRLRPAYDRRVRWRPDADICPECGFDWTQGRVDAIAVVTGGAGRADQILKDLEDPYTRYGERWSASMYLWHLVDVLRIGRVRLMTLEVDPQRGIPCWDENALAASLSYEMLSWQVGLEFLRAETPLWLEAARSASETSRLEHSQFGAISAREVICRNAHEVKHHLQDMALGLDQ